MLEQHAIRSLYEILPIALLLAECQGFGWPVSHGYQARAKRITGMERSGNKESNTCLRYP
jgi:hypothetical protein